MPTRKQLSTAQAYALRDIVEREDAYQDGSSDRVWWHDIGHHTARALLDRGLIEDDGRAMKCQTEGHTHPGYLKSTKAGSEACDREAKRRGWNALEELKS